MKGKEFFEFKFHNCERSIDIWECRKVGNRYMELIIYFMYDKSKISYTALY